MKFIFRINIKFTCTLLKVDKYIYHLASGFLYKLIQLAENLFSSFELPDSSDCILSFSGLISLASETITEQQHKHYAHRIAQYTITKAYSN